MSTHLHHSRVRRALRAAAVAAVSSTTVLALAACGSDDGDDDASAGSGAGDGASDLGDLSVQLSWIKNAEFAGEFMADTNGYYTDAGFSEVTLTAGPGATPEPTAWRTWRAPSARSTMRAGSSETDPPMMRMTRRPPAGPPGWYPLRWPPACWWPWVSA